MPNTKPKKQAILEAAARLFRDKGYRATSMRDLAKEVALKASSLYNHIGSKEEILQNICFSNARRFLAGMAEVEQMNDPAADKLRALLRLHIHIAMEDVTSVTAFNDEWRHLSEPHLEKFTALRKDYETRFKAIIVEGIQKGDLKAINASIAMYSILSSVRWLYDWFQPGLAISPEQLERDITLMLMNGLQV